MHSDDLKDDPVLMRAIADGVSLADYCDMTDEDIDKEYDKGTAEWERLRQLAESHGTTITVPDRGSYESFRKLYRSPMNEQQR